MLGASPGAGDASLVRGDTPPGVAALGNEIASAAYPGCCRTHDNNRTKRRRYPDEQGELLIMIAIFLSINRLQGRAPQ